MTLEQKEQMEKLAHGYWDSLNLDYPVNVHATTIYKAGFQAAMSIAEDEIWATKQDARGGSWFKSAEFWENKYCEERDKLADAVGALRFVSTDWDYSGLDDKQKTEEQAANYRLSFKKARACLSRLGQK